MPEQDRAHTPAASAAYEPPSAKKLGQGAITAALVALVVLVTVVMPAEYGVDPLGTGRILGISELAEPETVAPGEASLDPLTDDGFQVDAVSFVLRPGEATEYKIQIAAGQVLHYEWATDNGRRMFYDFHGDQADAGDQPASHKDGSGSEDSGTFEVPFTGRHGWYWNNPGPETVEITVRFAGQYDVVGFV